MVKTTDFEFGDASASLAESGSYAVLFWQVFLLCFLYTPGFFFFLNPRRNLLVFYFVVIFLLLYR